VKVTGTEKWGEARKGNTGGRKVREFESKSGVLEDVPEKEKKKK